MMNPVTDTPVAELLRNSAIVIMGPQAINGLECLTSKVDGCWVWSPSSKPKTVKPETLRHMSRFEFKPVDVDPSPPLEAKAKSKTPSKPAKKTTARRPAKKAKTAPGRRAFDWHVHENLAGRGLVPPVPKLRSYRPHMQQVHSMAMKKDADAIREFSNQFVDKKGGRANLFRYIDLCQKALSVKKAKTQ